MKTLSGPNLYVALIHYPVVNKNGAIIASAVTNLDLHDISRAAKTYGARMVYAVTPLADQQVLIRQIVSHWQTGAGATYNPKRQAALALICVKETLQKAIDDITKCCGRAPKTVATCARAGRQTIGFGQLRDAMTSERPYLLLLGTAWGLAEALMQSCDYVLEPIRGRGAYNHLSVRAAAAVILDRLMQNGHGTDGI